jgi:anaerobic magnesium-protoporphyrin IX monomethyl ester cyclase
LEFTSFFAQFYKRQALLHTNEVKKIFLLHPFNPLEGYHYPVPQVALGYLSSALKERGYADVKILDALLYKMDPEKVIQNILKEKPDVLGIRVWSHQLAVVKLYVSTIRSLLPKCKIILGGPHLTVSDPNFLKDFFDSNFIDFAFSGEAEEGFPLLIDHLMGRAQDLNSIPGLIFQEEKICLNPMSKKEDLDAFRVDWDALSLPEYHRLAGKTTSYSHGNSKNAFLFMTRGCPYPCTYCAAGITNGKKIRSHSALRMMEDIEYLYHKYGVRHFNLMDDNFTFYREIVLDFCGEFLKRKSKLPGVTFHNPNGVRVDRLDPEMLSLMKECGWKWLHIGLESGSKSTLLKMKKRLDLEKAQKNIQLIHDTGIRTWGFFMIGFLDETRIEIEQTIDWAVKSKLTAATFSIFSPIPGTEVYKEMVKMGRIPENYMMSGYMSPKQMVFAKNLSPEDLQAYQRKALLRFYRRPDRAYHLLRDMDLSTITNRVFQIFCKKTA